MSKKSVEQVQESFDGLIRQVSQEFKSSSLNNVVIKYLSDLHEKKIADAKGRYWGHYSDKRDFLNLINQRLLEPNLQAIFLTISKLPKFLVESDRNEIEQAVKKYLDCLFTASDLEFNEIGKGLKTVIMYIIASIIEKLHKEWVAKKEPIEEEWRKLLGVASTAEKKKFEDLTQEFNGEGDNDRLKEAEELIKDLQLKNTEINFHILNLKNLSEQIKKSKALILEIENQNNLALEPDFKAMKKIIETHKIDISSLKDMVESYDEFEKFDESFIRTRLVEKSFNEIMGKNRQVGAYKREIIKEYDNVDSSYKARQKVLALGVKQAEQVEVGQEPLLRVNKPAEVRQDSPSEIKGRNKADNNAIYKNMADLVKNRIETYRTKLYIINIGCFSIKSSSVALKISLLTEVLRLINNKENITDNLVTWKTEAYGRFFGVTQNDKNFHDAFAAKLKDFSPVL